MNLWLILGFAAQMCFFTRFFVQWVASERKGMSTIPLGFWYFSVIGGAGMLAYSIHIKDPVFIVGQGVGLFIYMRNLMLIHRKSNKVR